VCCVFAGVILPGTAAGGETPVTSEKAQAEETHRGTQRRDRDGAGTRTMVLASGIQKWFDVRYVPDRGSAGLCDVYLPAKVSRSVVEQPDPQRHGSGGSDAGHGKTPTAAPAEWRQGSAERRQGSADQRQGSVDQGQGKRWPTVLVVHGGGWATGDKWTMDRHSRKLAESGYAAVAINYRHAPAHKFPAQVDDVRAALSWIAEHAETYGFDCERIGLFGYSAGGHLVSLVGTLADEKWDTVALTTDWKQNDPRWKTLPKIRAVCAGGPPTDFQSLPPDSELLAFFLGGSRRQIPEVYAAASPVRHTTADDPPFQIIHGETDGIVPVDSGRRLYRSLLKHQVAASIQTLPNNGHLLAFINPELTRTMLKFYATYLGQP
jgi:triacylglycerol lipase